MKVSSVMHPDPITCRTIDNGERAAQLMRDHEIGSLPVIDEHGRIAGFVTDRDLCMAALARKEPLAAIPVTSAMSTPVQVCTPDDDVEVAADLMAAHRLHRLPVVNRYGLPIGLLSLDDLARAAAAHRVPAKEVVSSLAAASAKH